MPKHNTANLKILGNYATPNTKQTTLRKIAGKSFSKHQGKGDKENVDLVRNFLFYSC